MESIKCFICGYELARETRKSMVINKEHGICQPCSNGLFLALHLMLPEPLNTDCNTVGENKVSEANP